jgi:hypothetical protein
MLMRRIGMCCQTGLSLGLAMTLAALLAGCAASRVPPVPLTASPHAGAYVEGTIVAVRDAGAATGTIGLVAVLAALNQPALLTAGQPALATAGQPAQPTAGQQELVIRRADNSVTSLVQAPGPAAPAFHAGEKIAIITAADTIVRPE